MYLLLVRATGIILIDQGLRDTEVSITVSSDTPVSTKLWMLLLFLLCRTTTNLVTRKEGYPPQLFLFTTNKRCSSNKNYYYRLYCCRCCCSIWWDAQLGYWCAWKKVAVNLLFLAPFCEISMKIPPKESSWTLLLNWSIFKSIIDW